MRDMVFMVSAGMERPKKRDSLFARRQQYLNYGALILATTLERKGFPVRLIHGGHKEATEFAQYIISEGAATSRFPLLISMTSFYALSWTKNFTNHLKLLNPRLKIVIGGRWVVGSNPKWLHEALPAADLIVPGLAEDFIDKIVINEYELSIRNNSRALPNFPLNHRLVDGFQEFQPSIEASRGCGMGCSFCEEREVKLTPLKSPENIVRDIFECTLQYGATDIHPYIQSSFFAPNVKWAEGMATEVSRVGQVIPWRCESRVDALKPESIAALAKAGLKVIDLGMETASETQMLRMKKTDNPEKYLRKASELLRACAENGVWAKLNFLLYAGETMETYNESIRWFDEHSSAIKGISAGPVVIFGPPSASKTFIDECLYFGGRIVDESSSSNLGVSHLHLSDEISSETAERLSLSAARRYMSMIDYFDLKSFSYYPRSYSLSDFESDIYGSERASLPFSLKK